MDRTEKVGLAVAGAGHLALLALLAFGVKAAPNQEALKQRSIEISLAPEVAPVQTAPPAPEPPSASVAPDEGPPEDAAPPEPVEAPPVPTPAPAPPPKPAKPKPVPTAEPEPAPKPKPVPKPEPAPKPKPAPKPVATAKSKPPKPAASEAPAKPARSPAKAAPAKAAPAKPAAAAKPSAAKGEGATETAKAARPRGSHLGADFLKGLSADAPAAGKPSAAAPGATMNAKAAADIGSAIRRQVQPCANRNVTPGPGAERIRVFVRLSLNRDGSLASAPRVVNHQGVDDDNRRYLDRVDDLAIATYSGCAPLKGLPDELYDVQNGWRNFTLTYKLPG